ncbi:uncharacterized protein LOC113944883 [Corapipo altera]|uniref:uncharacterized protein LOC113944883 n=1 Tax=Corapipo altera TaxID=415028 RepID=UPI000FD64236|nr:uncharacterized protein LOC113944883 [Corapipo altera]
MSSLSLTCNRGEEPDHHQATTFQVLVERDKVTPKPLFLQAKQRQLPQPLLVGTVLQTLPQTSCPAEGRSGRCGRKGGGSKRPPPGQGGRDSPGSLLPGAAGLECPPPSAPAGSGGVCAEPGTVSRWGRRLLPAGLRAVGRCCRRVSAPTRSSWLPPPAQHGHGGWQVPAKVAQRAAVISILADLQKPSGHCPRQPAVSGPQVVPHWRYSRTAWMQPCATCSRTTLLEQGSCTRWPTVVRSNPTHPVSLSCLISGTGEVDLQRSVPTTDTL